MQYLGTVEGLKSHAKSRWDDLSIPTETLMGRFALTEEEDEALNAVWVQAKARQRGTQHILRRTVARLIPSFDLASIHPQSAVYWQKFEPLHRYSRLPHIRAAQATIVTGTKICNHYHVGLQILRPECRERRECYMLLRLSEGFDTGVEDDIVDILGGSLEIPLHCRRRTSLMDQSGEYGVPQVHRVNEVIELYRTAGSLADRKLLKHIFGLGVDRRRLSELRWAGRKHCNPLIRSACDREYWKVLSTLTSPEIVESVRQSKCN